MFEDLYDARLAFDLKRQPTFKDTLLVFDEMLRKELLLGEPYRLTIENRKKFSNVLMGKAIEISATFEKRVLFRLASLSKLLQREGVSRRVDRTSDKETLFQEALAEFENQGAPLPLTWVAENGCQVEGLRRIDFWTDLDLQSGDLERNAYRVGLPRDWFPVEDPIVLLCSFQAFRVEKRECKLHLPSVLDGYDFGPFWATLEADKPEKGHTLDLYDIENLQSGVPEFVSSGLPVEVLSFVPMIWRSGRPAPSLDRSFQANSPLVGKLVDFFGRGV